MHAIALTRKSAAKSTALRFGSGAAVDLPSPPPRDGGQRPDRTGIAYMQRADARVTRYLRTGIAFANGKLMPACQCRDCRPAHSRARAFVRRVRQWRTSAAAHPTRRDIVSRLFSFLDVGSRLGLREIAEALSLPFDGYARDAAQPEPLGPSQLAQRVERGAGLSTWSANALCAALFGVQRRYPDSPQHRSEHLSDEYLHRSEARARADRVGGTRQPGLHASTRRWHEGRSVRTPCEALDRRPQRVVDLRKEAKQLAMLR
jgi:hypothetical protein